MTPESPTVEPVPVPVENFSTASPSVAKPSVRWRLIDLLEWGLAILVTLVLIVAHVKFLKNAGGLWRDEANTVNIATSPTLREMSERLEFESFPFLWPICVRSWNAVGLASQDQGYRVLGMIVGLSLLAGLWVQSLLLSRQPPLFSLIAVGALPAVLRYGDSVRAYGLGTLLMVATLVAVWKTVERCSLRRWIIAAIFATASVYCLYHNCVFVFVSCMAGSVAALWRRDWKTVFVVPLIGAVAAGLLVLGQGSRLWKKPEWLDLVVRNNVTPEALAERFREALTTGGVEMPLYWKIAAVTGLVAAILCLTARRSRNISMDRSQVAFFTTGLVLAPACYLLFLLNLGFVTEPWYYMGVLTFLAVCIDQLLQCYMQPRRGLRWIRWGCLVVLLSAMWRPLWQQVQERMTNIDLIAARVNQAVEPGDLVITNPWWLGVSFGRCYNGAAEWITVPELEDRVCHRYDLVRKRLAEIAPLQSVFDKIDRTLRSGKKVYQVGQVFPANADGLVLVIPPAPNSQTGWHEGPYLTAWGQQVTSYLALQARSGTPVDFDGQIPISSYEHMRLLRCDGWEGRDRGSAIRNAAFKTPQ